MFLTYCEYMERVKKYGKLSMPERGERMKHNTKLSYEK